MRDTVDFCMSSTIRIDAEVFDENYMPSNPVVQREELSKVESLLKQGRIVYLWAKPGTGKTFLAKQLLAKKQENKIYLQFLNSVPESLASFLSVTSPFIATRTSVLMQMFEQRVRSNRIKPVLIVFDDLQELRRAKDIYTFLGNLMRRLEKPPRMPVQLLLISQTPYFKLSGEVEEAFEPKGGSESRAQLAHETLKPYDQDQIKEILLERLQLATEASHVDYEIGAINFFTSQTLRHNSDMRMALRLLRIWLQSGKLTYKEAEESWTSEKKGYWANQIRGLHRHQAALVHIICRLKHPVTTPELDGLYAKFCKEYGCSRLDYTQVTRLLHDLKDKVGLIDMVELKRHGRPYAVSLHESVTKENVIEATADIDWSMYLH